MAGGKKIETYYVYQLSNCDKLSRKLVFTDKELFDSKCNDCTDTYEYNDDLDICERFIEEEPIVSGNHITIEEGVKISSYGWGGARFYKPLENEDYPIKENSQGIFKNFNDDTVSVLYQRDYFWKNTTGINGRLNEVGVWGNVPNGEWVGFSTCIKRDEKKKINIGIGSDNCSRVKLNGVLLIEMDVNIQNSFNYWHVFEIELSKGRNVIEFLGKNLGSYGSFGAEIYDLSQEELISITSIDQLNNHIVFSTKHEVGSSFAIGEESGYICNEGWYLDNCGRGPVCVKKETTEKTPCDLKVYKFKQYPCECWNVIDFSVVSEYTKEQLIELGAEYVDLLEEYLDCKDCHSGKDCNFGERTIAYSLMVKLPEIAQPDRGFKECCYDNLVLGHLTDSNYSYNDFNSFYFKKQTPSDSCYFVLIELSSNDEYAFNDDTYGQFWDFGDFQTQPNLTVYKVEWRKVLDVLGTGLYQIKKVMTVAGIQFEELSNTFHLEHFSNELADKTVRLDSVMDGKLVHLDVDFKGTGFATSIRTQGYFGNRNPEYAQDNLVKRNYDTVQISMSQENEYQYQTSLLPVCITEEIYDFMLFGNKLYMNDYNLANHSYRYFKFPVELKGNKGSNYYPNIRDSRINLTFTDREKDKRKLNC